jgi:hypothetical protein
MTYKSIVDSCSLNVCYISKSLVRVRALLIHYKTRLWLVCLRYRILSLTGSRDFFPVRIIDPHFEPHPVPHPAGTANTFLSGSQVTRCVKLSIQIIQCWGQGMREGDTPVPGIFYGISDLNLDKHNTWTAYVLLLSFLQNVLVFPSDSHQIHHIKSVLRKHTSPSCTCVFYLLMVG